MPWLRKSLLSFAVLALAGVSSEGARADAVGDYKTHCAACHGVDRLGGTGPALLPESLKRLRRGKTGKVITNGRPLTQMPAFKDDLSAEQISAIEKYIKTPPKVKPVWLDENIRASHEILSDPNVSPDKPQFDADPLNLFIVVETGDHHATLLNGDTFEPITRFETEFALHGGPKFSPDGKFVYFGSRDGWVTKYDIYAMKYVARVRAGINTRNIAISGDGEVLAVANYLPHSLVFLDAHDLTLIKSVPTRNMHKNKTSRVSAVYQARPRNSFIAAMKDIPEIWEIPYEKGATVVSGLAHSSEKGREETLPQKDRFPIRRIELTEPLDDFFFDPSYRKLMGSTRGGGKGVVVHLDVRREIAELPIDGFPHLGSGITWERDGRRIMASPNLKEGAISVIDLETWKEIKRIKTDGPGFFMRSHKNSRYAWADVFFGPNKDAVHIFDKQSLEIVKTIRPVPGKVAAHIEFTKDGKYALLSIWDMDGAVIVYDAETLEEVKRLPMVKPSGKYNVFNKITFEEGTSH